MPDLILGILNKSVPDNLNLDFKESHVICLLEISSSSEIVNSKYSSNSFFWLAPSERIPRLLKKL